MSVEKKASLVFIPFPIMSHLAAAVATARLLSERDERLAVTVLIMKMPADTKISSYVTNARHESRINFVHIPESESFLQEMAELESPKDNLARFIECQKEGVTEAIKSRNLSPVSGFVIDMLCTGMIDVANDFGAATYVLFTCGVAALGLAFDLQCLKDAHDQDLSEYEDSDAVISVATFVNPVPARVWPAETFVKGRVFPEPLIRSFEVIKGVLVNSFLEFEHHAVRALSVNEKIPPVYAMGPILGNERVEDEDKRDEKNDVVGWLDEQPDSSVVFLCFGSLGCFQEDQVKEIAIALEQSKQRFLWSLRKPIPKEKLEFPGEYENPDEVLPEGFLERTKTIGKVIGWAPQMAVLSHPAVGGFVSHCGWNSILESVWFGVPIATFPLFAEQQVNAFQLVKDFGMAEMIRLDYRIAVPEIVGAEEIEAAIRRLMAVEGGNGVREKVKEMQKKARLAVVKGGSSYNALSLFVEDVIKGSPSMT